MPKARWPISAAAWLDSRPELPSGILTGQSGWTRSHRGIFRTRLGAFLRGDAAGAISDLTRAIDLNPQHSVAFMFRGEAHRDKGETDRAIADLTEAIRLGVPDWGDAYGQRGVERLRKGDLKEPWRTLRKQSSPTANSPLARDLLMRSWRRSIYLEAHRFLGQATRTGRFRLKLCGADGSLSERLARPLLNSAQQQSAKPQKPKADVAPKRSGASR